MFAMHFGSKNWFTVGVISRFNYWNRNGISFPFLSFQVRMLMQRNFGPFIKTVFIAFCIFLTGGGGGGGAWDRFSHNSWRK